MSGYKEEQIKEQLDSLEWLREAIISYSQNNTVETTNMRVYTLTEVTGHIAKLKRELYECQNPTTF